MKNYLNEIEFLMQLSAEFTVKEMCLRNSGIPRKQVECY